ncbi:hypothetical protein AMECASPLE_014939 [Ameca splendens]|uniref:Uncharacterized protein n=1 Tax=Ameca splendens TaxID=208324 RepID=A0ABV0XQL5_9TELE
MPPPPPTAFLLPKAKRKTPPRSCSQNQEPEKNQTNATRPIDHKTPQCQQHQQRPASSGSAVPTQPSAQCIPHPAPQHQARDTYSTNACMWPPPSARLPPHPEQVPPGTVTSYIQTSSFINDANCID